MDFANERYVRLYVRNTTSWKLLGWEGRNVWTMLYREADRSGVISLDGLEPWEAAVLHCEFPEEVAKVGMARCLKREWIVQDGDRLVFPKYLEANETPQSDAQRQRESRAKRAAVTKRDAIQSQTVTECHGQSHAVTSCHSDPIRADPEELPPPSGASREGSDFMQNATGRFYGTEHRRELVLIASKPAAERARVLAAIRGDPWCKSNTAVDPKHVLREWAKYLDPPKLKSAPRPNGVRYAGPSRVATAAEYEADKTEKGPWET